MGDYFVDGTWYFTNSFFTRHLNIILDILRTPIQVVDQRIWLDSLDGVLTSRQCYEFLRSSLLHTAWDPWIWALFIPQIRSSTICRAVLDKLSTSGLL